MLRVIEYVAKSLKIIGNSTIRYIACEFLIGFIVIMPLSCVVFEMKRDIGRNLR